MKRLIGPADGNDEGQIDRILSREDEILPSSGFTVSVMDAVRREAAAPPPIPFPWKRVLPGLLVGGLAFVLVIVVMLMAIAQSAKATGPQLPALQSFGMSSLLNGGLGSATSWIVFSLVIALVSVKMSFRLASGRT